MWPKVGTKLEQNDLHVIYHLYLIWKLCKDNRSNVQAEKLDLKKYDANIQMSSIQSIYSQ